MPTITGPRILVTDLVGFGGLPPNFLTRPTINGSIFGPYAWPVPTLTATLPASSFITSAGVAFNLVAYEVDGNNVATLKFQAAFTPSTTSTGGAFGGFTITAPNRVTQWVLSAGIVGHCSIKDENGIMAQGAITTVPSSLNLNVSFFPTSTAMHYAECTVSYKLV